jgi:hypothetical protein
VSARGDGWMTHGQMKPRAETLKNHFGVEELLRAPT